MCDTCALIAIKKHLYTIEMFYYSIAIITMEISHYKWNMEKVLQHLQIEFSTLQIGRASTGLVENIDVFIPSYGMTQKLPQLGNVSLMDSQTIKIEAWDKSTYSSIEKAIYDANIGLTPQNQWEYIMIKIPPLTTERRKELTKLVAKMGEDAKVRVRNVRHEIIDEVKKEFTDKIISEDQKKMHEWQADDLAKDFSAKIDNAVKTKSDDIMTV
jgi:ribosome recycling factor